MTILLLAAFAHGPGSAAVQAQTANRQGNSSWELNVHAAAIRSGLFDESNEGFQFGGRLLKNFGSGVSLGGSVDWASTKDVTLRPFAGLNASLLLYSAGLEYRFRVSPRAALFLGAGVGAATLTFDEVPSGVQESSTGLLFPVGGGFKIYGRPEAPSWAFRVDFRDNVILLDTPTPGGEVTTEPRNNLELSAGFSLLLGSERRASLPVVDSDRDGVPDPRDRCFNRPGVEVDADGCPVPPPAARPNEEPAPRAMEPERAEPEPLPEGPAEVEGAAPDDGDGDGVLDDRDACPGTPLGIVVDERGCLARPPEETPEPSGDEPRYDFPQPRVERAPPEQPPSADDAPPPDPPAADPADAADACLETQDWFVEDEAIEYDGRPFETVGSPKPVDRQFLVRIGAYENVPIYVSDTAEPPYSDFWMPVCGSDDLFELFMDVSSLPWNR